MEKNIPPAPGVYLFKNDTGKVIYIGKAKDLKKRVSSYFTNKKHDKKTMNLVEEIKSTEFIVTNNETEALILESNLIKKFKGKYNVELRDNYRYPFIQLTNEKFPRFIVTRASKNSIKKTTNTWGPFVDAHARKKTIELLEKTFNLRTCKTLPKKACLKYYINQCSAPCIGNISPEKYHESVQNAIDFFDGKKTMLVKALEKEMNNFANKKMFEQAIQKRNAIRNIKESAKEKQAVDVFAKKNKDFIAWKKNPKGMTLVLLSFRKGTLLGKKVFEFNSQLVEDNIIEDFLINHYSEHAPPKKIVCNKKIFNKNAITKQISDAHCLPVELSDTPTAEEKRFTNLAEKNLSFEINPKENTLLELQSELSLPFYPELIEAFDISHLGGTGTTASMVSFLNGVPLKTGYRRFRIRTAKDGDDFAAMQEVIGRRYTKVIKENLKKPDLVLVDGGKPQVSAAKKVLSLIGFKVPLIGLAKKNEEIFTPSSKTPILLDKKKTSLKLLQEIRNEAHRFAKKYQKKISSN
jgi:excinuclease ABC subunit C